MKFYTPKRFMTKDEILQELNHILYAFSFDVNCLVIIGDAAKILMGIEPNITYDSDTKPKNIDIWVEPKYYEYILKSEEELSESPVDHNSVSFGYVYTNDNGSLNLHKGEYPRPKSKKMYGYNVQLCDAKNKSKMRSTVTNFRVVK